MKFLPNHVGSYKKEEASEKVFTNGTSQNTYSNSK